MNVPVWDPVDLTGQRASSAAFSEQLDLNPGRVRREMPESEVIAVGASVR